MMTNRSSQWTRFHWQTFSWPCTTPLGGQWGFRWPSAAGSLAKEGFELQVRPSSCSGIWKGYNYRCGPPGFSGILPGRPFTFPDYILQHPGKFYCTLDFSSPSKALMSWLTGLLTRSQAPGGPFWKEQPPQASTTYL